MAKKDWPKTVSAGRGEGEGSGAKMVQDVVVVVIHGVVVVVHGVLCSRFVFCGDQKSVEVCHFCSNGALRERVCRR